MEKNQQVIENAVEIAMNNLRELQNTVDMGRDRLISDFILKWAEEAEPEYQRVVKENGGEYPYYDFIDEFSEKKMVEVRELCRKGSLPAVPSNLNARDEFNGELKHIRSFSEKKTSSNYLHILTVQWNYDGEFGCESHAFHDHDSAEAYMRKQYDTVCERNPNWTDRDICQCSAHIFKDGESSDHHVVWKITENEVK
jgi:hypothetical protein